MADSSDGGQVIAVPEAKPHLRIVTGDSTPTLEFRAVFMDHYGFVCRALRSMGVDASSVEDVAQDVFMVLHRRFDEYEPSRDLRSWLWGIGRHAARTHARTVRRSQRKLRVIPPAAPTERPDEHLERQERAQFVADFLHRLPEDQRVVFVLAEIESRSAPEIATGLGVPLNTVYSRLRTARSQFKRAVTRHDARQRRSRG